MSREEMAFHIFLKRLPSGYLTENTRQAFTSCAKDALEIADVFLNATDNVLYDHDLGNAFLEALDNIEDKL